MIYHAKCGYCGKIDFARFSLTPKLRDYCSGCGYPIFHVLYLTDPLPDPEEKKDAREPKKEITD